MTAEIHQIPLGLTNCYLIIDEGTVLVDGGCSSNMGAKGTYKLMGFNIHLIC